MRRRFFVGFLLLVLAVGIMSCGDSAPVIYDGRELSEDEIAAMIRPSETEEQVELPPALPWDTRTEIPESERVYWTLGGSVWHTEADCRYIKTSDATLYYGTEADALSAGKKRICSGCEKKGE